MELTPKELMKQYVDSQNFTSTTQIMQAMKELLKVLIYGKCDVTIFIFFALSALNSISALVNSSSESKSEVWFFVDLSITFGKISSILVSESSSILFLNTLKFVIYFKVPFCNSGNFIIGKPS